MFRPGLVLLVACFLFISQTFSWCAQTPPAKQQSTFTVQGSVQSPDGKPLAGARVDIRSSPSSDDTLADTATDQDGSFAFFGVTLAPGPYLMHASAVGFGQYEKEFTVTESGGSSVLSFSLTLKPAPTERGTSSGFTVVHIFYATDRKQQVAQNAIQYLGERSVNGSLSYGSCDVSIPESHTVADLERPSIWRLEFYPDPEKHIMLQKVAAQPKTQFFKDVAAAVASAPAKEAFVFVHGYNVSFEDAALRTAQLDYDFGFKGAPIFYSWPSRGKLFGYLDDEDAIQQTVGNLKQFLQDVADQSGATVVHVIAHSMGNRAMLPALAQLSTDPHFKNFSKFNTVVFAAPDVDRDVFMNLVGQIKKPQNKITLYVSSNDQALAASHLLFHKEPRAGEGGSDAIVMTGLDTVDVSKLSMDALGHSYFGDNRTVVSDLLTFLKGKIAPRPGLSKVSMGSLALWQMLPTTSN